MQVQVTSLSQVFVHRVETMEDAGDGFDEWSVVDVCESADTSFASVLTPSNAGFGGEGSNEAGREACPWSLHPGTTV